VSRPLSFVVHSGLISAPNREPGCRSLHRFPDAQPMQNIMGDPPIGCQAGDVRPVNCRTSDVEGPVRLRKESNPLFGTRLFPWSLFIRFCDKCFRSEAYNPCLLVWLIGFAVQLYWPSSLSTLLPRDLHGIMGFFSLSPANNYA
jgi:hypothetical protein